MAGCVLTQELETSHYFLDVTSHTCRYPGQSGCIASELYNLPASVVHRLDLGTSVPTNQNFNTHVDTLPFIAMPFVAATFSESGSISFDRNASFLIPVKRSVWMDGIPEKKYFNI